MPMKRPPHPGFSVRHDCLVPLGLTITAGAKAQTRKTSGKITVKRYLAPRRQGESQTP